MTASKTMAKRAAAGTLALAVCLTGGLVSATTANAVLPATGGAVRVLPSQDPTTGAGAQSFQTAPIIDANAQDAAVASFQVVIPNQWVTGDRINVALPDGVTFNALPTVTASGPTTRASLAEDMTGDAFTATNLRTPTFTTNFPVVGNPGITSKSTVLLEFNNSSTNPTDPADDDDAVFVLTFSNVVVDTSDTTDLAQDITATVSGQSRAAADDPATPNVNEATTYATTDTFDAEGVTTIGFISPVGISIAAGQSLIPGGGEQSIGDITLDESIVDGLVDGDYVLTFTAANGTVTVGNPFPADTVGDTFDLEVTGDADLVDEDATATGNTLAFSVEGLEDDGALESFTLSNLRVSPSVGAGAIKVTLTTAPGADLAFVPTEVGTFSDVDSETLDATDNIGIIPQNQRIGGNDRYETAATIANAVGLNGSDSIVIASGEPVAGGVDALSANYLAGVLGAPILLTKANEVPEATRVAIRNLLTTNGGVANGDTANIYVVGGRTAVTDAVIADLRQSFQSDSFDLTVQRVAGDDRYETAASVATQQGVAPVGSFTAEFGQGAGKTAIVAAGLNPADALAAGPIAYAGATGPGGGFPLLLTGATSLPKSTLEALDSLAIKNVILTGGTAAVSEAVVTQLEALDITVVRVAGEDRYGTATALYELAQRDLGATAASPVGGLGWADPTAPYLANGVGFADALVAGPLAGLDEEPLLLTQPTQLSAATQTYIEANDDTIDVVNGVGLSAALPNAVLTAANQAAQD